MNKVLNYLVINRRARVFVLALASILIIASYRMFIYLNYMMSYNGFCGPYAPDIQRHQCSYETFTNNYDSGFSGVVIYLSSVLLGVVVFLISILIWMAFEKIRKRRDLS